MSMAYCWYCEREFEDTKVLLAHQKAKHFRCPHCPRRLNTAGGLAVHIDQVHKLGTDRSALPLNSGSALTAFARIANAIPGRDTFDVEIYGMEGVPANDLREWKRRKQLETGAPTEDKPPPKALTYDKLVISRDDFKRQLQAHKDLMEGKVAPSVAVNAFQGGPMLAPPPFSMGGCVALGLCSSVGSKRAQTTDGHARHSRTRWTAPSASRHTVRALSPMYTLCNNSNRPPPGLPAFVFQADEGQADLRTPGHLQGSSCHLAFQACLDCRRLLCLVRHQASAFHLRLSCQGALLLLLPRMSWEPIAQTAACWLAIFHIG
jgi:hypothetical protein